MLVFEELPLEELPLESLSEELPLELPLERKWLVAQLVKGNGHLEHERRLVELPLEQRKEEEEEEGQLHPKLELLQRVRDQVELQ